MEKDVTLDPVDVGLLSSDALMLHPEHVSNLVEEFGHVPDFTTETRPYPALLRIKPSTLDIFVFMSRETS